MITIKNYTESLKLLFNNNKLNIEITNDGHCLLFL
jgi:hypothetical protein